MEVLGRSSTPRDQTHRGPGSLHLHDQRSITHRDEQRVLQVNQDQRSVVHHHEHHPQVNQDQRSFVHAQDQRVLQVNVVVAPDRLWIVKPISFPKHTRPSMKLEPSQPKSSNKPKIMSGILKSKLRFPLRVPMPVH